MQRNRLPRRLGAQALAAALLLAALDTTPEEIRQYTKIIKALRNEE